MMEEHTFYMQNTKKYLRVLVSFSEIVVNTTYIQMNDFFQHIFGELFFPTLLQWPNPRL